MSEMSSSERFKKNFNSYYLKWGIVITILYIAAFALYTIGILNKHLDIALPSFLHTIVTLGCWSWMNDMVVEAIGIGFIAVGAISVGVVAIGACSVGVVAVGACSIGIFAWGAFSLGVIAIGQSVGVIAIGPAACGVYTLSYKGKGRHVFSPDRQDADAVAFFTRWLPKFKGASFPAS